MRPSKFQAASVALILLGLTGCASSPQEKEAKFLKRGKALLSHNDYARAFLEFKNASAAQPRDAEPYYQMGVANLRTGNIQAAVGNLRKATELNPKHEGAQLRLAELMTASRIHELTEKAEGILEQVLLVSPDNTEAIDALAAAEYQLGQTDVAIKRLEDVLKRFPADLESAVALAALKLTQQDPNGAEEVLKKAVESAPNSAAAAVALGQFYAARRKMDLAEAQTRRALKLDPKNPSALFSLATIQVTSNRSAEAEQTYKTISGLSDKRYRPLHAIFLFQQNKREAALSEFQILAAQDPQDRAARTRLVAIYAISDRIPEAERILNQALRRNAKDHDALLQRSELYLLAGKPGEAEKDLQMLQHLDPTSAEVHFGLARVQRLQGQARNERQELTEAIRLNPNLLPARLTLVRSFLSTFDTKSALELLDRTPAPQKTRQEVVIETNWALLLAGRSREARPHINQVLKVARVPDAVLQDGTVRLVEKDYAGARADAEEVLQKNPEDLRAVHLMLDTYAAQRQASKGTDRLRQLVSQRPDSAPLQKMLVQLAVSSKNSVEARTVLETLKRAAPQSTEADVALAGLDVDEKHFTEARQRLLSVVTIAPRNVRALLMLADLEIKTNDPGAIATYRSILEIDGSNLIALNNLAYCLAKESPNEALKFAQKAMELAPGSANANDTLGWVYYRKGLYHRAVPYFKAAVEKEPTPVRQFHLGMTYLKTGQADSGRQLVESAAKKNPDLLKTELDR